MRYNIKIIALDEWTIKIDNMMHNVKKGVLTIKKTFDNQHKLQKFPIPPLSSTHAKLLEWIKPLVNEQEYALTVKVANEFFKEHGDAEKLQQQLIKLKEATTGSWLTPFWNNQYLEYRGALPTGVHFNILVNQPPLKKELSRAELAGKASFLVGEYYHKIIDEAIEPVTFKGVPLDMGQYKRFFRSIRIPKTERDQFAIADFDKRNNFVVFIYRNNMYRIPVTNENGQLYQSEKIIELIEQILQSSEEEGINIGLFTTIEREQAARIYNELKVSECNAKNLEALKDALLVISIDEESENGHEAVQGLMLNSRNKYFDKTIQLVITKKGRIGYSIEHTAVDGTTIFAVISYINEGLTSTREEIIQTEDKPQVQQFKWEVSAELQKTFIQLEKESEQRKALFHIEAMPRQTFGAEAIKQMKISPDAFFHMALQLAQYRTFNTFHSVYEPVSIRHFKEGRTECARATSMEKSAVVDAIENNQPNAEIYRLMEQASAAHSKRITESRNGLGVERHMFGLEQVYVNYKDQLGMTSYPAIFSNLGYKTLRTDFLSTSGMAYDNVHARVFGPVVKGGFGIAYILLEHSISLNISCRSSEKAQAKQLSDNMIKALVELKEIAEEFCFT